MVIGGRRTRQDGQFDRHSRSSHVLERRGKCQEYQRGARYVSRVAFFVLPSPQISLVIPAVARIMLKYMDKSVDPCQDFYRYACGNWAKLNPIPKDKAGYDTFEMLRESLDSVLRELLEDPVPHDVAQSDADDAIVKAKYLFESCMNYGKRTRDLTD